METITAETSRGPEGPMHPQRMEQPSISKEHKQMRVLMAVDETDDSFYALKWVLEKLFKHCSSASATPDQLEQDHHLTLVHVVQIFPQYVFPGAPGWNIVVPVVPLGPLGEAVIPATSVVGSVTKVQKENAAVLLSRALEICKEKKIVAETLILEGVDTKEIICQATEEMNVDLLVVGSRGLGKIKRAFLGSVSDYCAHHAKCPVLIVKPPKEFRK